MGTVSSLPPWPQTCVQAQPTAPAVGLAWVLPRAVHLLLFYEQPVRREAFTRRDQASPQDTRPSEVKGGIMNLLRRMG